jgi:hypothetical protein
MSRAGYTDDGENPIGYVWASIVNRAAHGKRGQKFLADLAAALDAMPVKELIPNALEAEGQFCTLGVICHAKGISMAEIDPDDYEHWDMLAGKLDIARTLVREIEYENDEGIWRMEATPTKRWEHMRRWVDSKILERSADSASGSPDA